MRVPFPRGPITVPSAYDLVHGVGDVVLNANLSASLLFYPTSSASVPTSVMPFWVRPPDHGTRHTVNSYLAVSTTNQARASVIAHHAQPQRDMHALYPGNKACEHPIIPRAIRHCSQPRDLQLQLCYARLRHTDISGSRGRHGRGTQTHRHTHTHKEREAEGERRAEEAEAKTFTALFGGRCCAPSEAGCCVRLVLRDGRVGGMEWLMSGEEVRVSPFSSLEGG